MFAHIPWDLVLNVVLAGLAAVPTTHDNGVAGRVANVAKAVVGALTPGAKS
jgi:hypothetical protein